MGLELFKIMTADELLSMDFPAEFPDLWNGRDKSAPYVYFMLAHDDGTKSLGIHNAKYVKIGVAEDPHRRETAIQSACPLEVNLWNCTRGGYPLEKKLHDFLKDFRTFGEWFRVSDLVIRVMQDAPVDMPEIVW